MQSAQRSGGQTKVVQRISCPTNASRQATGTNNAAVLKATRQRRSADWSWNYLPRADDSTQRK